MNFYNEQMWNKEINIKSLFRFLKATEMSKWSNFTTISTCQTTKWV